MSPHACRQCQQRQIGCQFSAPSEVCTTCTKRGVACSGKPAPYPPGHKFRRVAKGARIEEYRRALEEGRLQDPRRDSTSAPLPVTPPPSPPSLSPELTLAAPGDMLNRHQLTTALNYHLVLSAHDAAEGSKPGTSLSRIAHRLEQSGLRASPVDDPPSTSTFSIPGPSRRTTPTLGQDGETQELILACFAAVGARVSQHTALFCDTVLDIDSLEHLGLRRDTACMLLIDRAIRIADESGFLDLSKVNLDIAHAMNLLRHTINVVAPHHSANVSLTYALHRLRLETLGEQQQSRDAEAWKYSIQDIVLADTEAALRLHTRCILTDEDLLEHFGWSPISALHGMQHLNDLVGQPFDSAEHDAEEVYDHVLSISVLLGRSLVALRAQGHTHSPSDLQHAFLDLADTCDQLQDVHSARVAHATEHEPEIAEWWLSLIEGQTREALTFAASVCETVQHLSKEWGGVEYEEVKRRWEEMARGLEPLAALRGGSGASY